MLCFFGDFLEMDIKKRSFFQIIEWHAGFVFFSCSSPFFLRHAIGLSQCTATGGCLCHVECIMQHQFFGWSHPQLELAQWMCQRQMVLPSRCGQACWHPLRLTVPPREKNAFHGSIHTGFRTLLFCWAWQTDVARSDNFCAQYLCRATRALWRSWQRPWCGFSLGCQAMSCLAIPHSKVDWGCDLLRSGVRSLLVFLFLVEGFC